MQRPAQGDLALDVDHLAAPQPDLRGDAARLTEGEPAEADDRQPVELADLLTVGLNTDRAAADLLLQTAIDAVAAADLRIDRRLDLDEADDILAGVARELVGFAQQIDKSARAGGQFVGVAGEPGRLLDDSRDGGAVQRAQFLARHPRADEAGGEKRRV